MLGKRGLRGRAAASEGPCPVIKVGWQRSAHLLPASAVEAGAAPGQRGESLPKMKQRKYNAERNLRDIGQMDSKEGRQSRKKVQWRRGYIFLLEIVCLSC